MSQRWAPQTRYTFRHHTASIMKCLVWFYDFFAVLFCLSYEWQETVS